jgi:hypothetical protein
MYITYNEVIERYPMLKTWAGNSPMLNNEIAYAEYELNSRLATHFTVPISGTYYLIKDLAIDLTYYRTLRIKDPDQAAKIKDFINERIDGIKKGDELLIDTSGTQVEFKANAVNEIWSNVEDYHPAFSMLDTSNIYSQVDSARLEAEETERQ